MKTLFLLLIPFLIPFLIQAQQVHYYYGENVDELSQDYQKNGVVYGEKPTDHNGKIRNAVLGKQNTSHFRSEVAMKPWSPRFKKGTHTWTGFRMTAVEFGKLNKASVNIFQNKTSKRNQSPQYSLRVVHGAAYGGKANQNEIYFRMSCQSDESRGYPQKGTGVIFETGVTVDIIIHSVFGDYSNGQIEVWIEASNGKSFHYQDQTSTVWLSNPVGGRNKYGLYGRDTKMNMIVDFTFREVISSSSVPNGKALVDPKQDDPAGQPDPVEPCECPGCDCDEPAPPIKIECPPGMKLATYEETTTSGGTWIKKIGCVPEDE